MADVLDPWVGLIGLAITLLGLLLRHVATDARREQRLRSVEHRLKKVDGIEANGD